MAAYADVPETATILFTSSPQLAQRDVIAIRPEGAGSPKPYLDAAWDEMDPRVSPDGTLASFTSREQGPWEVWIRDYPVPRGKWKVSTDGGHNSRWSSDGRFLYYWKSASVAGESLFRVPVDRTSAVIVRAPQFVLTFGFFGGPRNWDLHPDGKRGMIRHGELDHRGPASLAASPDRA